MGREQHPEGPRKAGIPAVWVVDASCMNPERQQHAGRWCRAALALTLTLTLVVQGRGRVLRTQLCRLFFSSARGCHHRHACHRQGSGLGPLALPA